MLNPIRKLAAPPRTPGEPWRLELTLNLPALLPAPAIQVILLDAADQSRPLAVLEHRLGSKA